MKLSLRIHEWLADRISWVQYPHIRPVSAASRAASRSGLHFKHAMPLGKRLDLFIFSLLLLMIGLAALAGTLLFIYLLVF